MHLRKGRDRRRDMRDVLRSLGALLDARLARDVRISETPGGLRVRARMVGGVMDRIEGRWIAAERELSRLDIQRLRAEARIRRGRDHVPGRHERFLRVVGRVIDDRGLRDVTLMEHPGRGWLVWHTEGASARAVLTYVGEGDLLSRDDDLDALRETLIRVDGRARATA
jgi:hypothetical protein